MTFDLRIKIAESLGWKIEKLAGIWPDHYQITRPDGDSYAQVELDDVLPNWPGDANDALQLVEVLKKEGWKFMYDNIGTLAEAEFFKSGPRVSHLGHAPTLPEAICLAYFAVKSIQTNK